MPRNKKKQTKKSISPEALQQRAQRNQKLYQALVSIYQFSKLEDLLLLKSKKFLSLCEVAYIGWDLKESLFKDTVLFLKNNRRHSSASPYWIKLALEHQEVFYGHLIFASSHKISKTKVNFLKKITQFAAASLHHIQGIKQAKKREHDWNMTFNSFYQALCITDKNFKIVRSNLACINLIAQKQDNSIGKNFFEQFAWPITPDLPTSGEGSWISKGVSNNQEQYLRFTVKNIFLTNKRVSFYLILAEEVTESCQMERVIAEKARNRDVGLIKTSIAHQLNNPIAGIKALLYVLEHDLAKQDFLGESFLSETLADLKEAVSRSQSIVQNLLSASRCQEEQSETEILEAFELHSSS